MRSALAYRLHLVAACLLCASCDAESSGVSGQPGEDAATDGATDSAADSSTDLGGEGDPADGTTTDSDGGEPADGSMTDGSDGEPADGSMTDGGDGDGDAATSCVPTPTSALVVSVADTGAKGNGIADDTAAIQAAVDQVAGTGGSVLVPDGTYLVDALTSVRLKSKMTFRMSSGAVLKAIPNGASNYQMLRIDAASDVYVVGGTLQGERYEHTGTTGEWGFCAAVLGASHVVFEGVVARDCWGDGFYIGRSFQNDTPSQDATFCSVVAEGNRRLGMAIVAVDGVLVQDSVFKNNIGTNPQVGIDIEPNEGDVIRNVQILRSQILGNGRQGLTIGLYFASSQVENVELDGNAITENAMGGIAFWGGANHRIVNNTIVDDTCGIYLGKGVICSTGNTITGNTITVPADDDIQGACSPNTISGNTFP